MRKSGLIVGAVSFIAGLIASIFTPLCAPCVAVFAGIVAGYLAGLFDKPADQGSAAKLGASSGAIAGVGALIGTMIAAAFNMVIVGPEGAAALSERFGLPTGDPATAATMYYVSTIVVHSCIGLFNIAMMAGLGALGGILWLQTGGKKSTGTPSM